MERVDGLGAFFSALPQRRRWRRQCLKGALPPSGIYTDLSLATNQACRNHVENESATPTLSCRLAAAQAWDRSPTISTAQGLM